MSCRVEEGRVEREEDPRPHRVSLHTCAEGCSQDAPHRLSLEIRELEGGAQEEATTTPKSTHSAQNSRNVNLAQAWIKAGGSFPSLFQSKQLLPAEAWVGQALGPSSRKPSTPAAPQVPPS